MKSNILATAFSWALLLVTLVVSPCLAWGATCFKLPDSKRALLNDFPDLPQMVCLDAIDTSPVLWATGKATLASFDGTVTHSQFIVVLGDNSGDNSGGGSDATNSYSAKGTTIMADFGDLTNLDADETGPAELVLQMRDARKLETASIIVRIINQPERAVPLTIEFERLR